MKFLRIEMETEAITSVVQQRHWDRYPTEYVVKPGITEGLNKQKGKPTPVAPNLISWPKITFVQRSWDFVPPDVTRPLATSTVGDIAILVRRTGMVWKTFDPFNSNMNAEGGPHVISSMEVRGLGVVLCYQCLDQSLTERVATRRQRSSGREASVGRRRFRGFIGSKTRILAKDEEKSSVNDSRGNVAEACSPQLEGGGILASESDFDGSPRNPHGPWPAAHNMWYVGADKRLFGLIPSDPAFGIQDFRHGTKKECWDELKALCMGDEAAVRHIDRALWMERYEFNDILMMVPEVSRQRGKPRAAYHTVDYIANVMIWTTEAFKELVTRYLSGESFLEKLGRAEDGRPVTYHDGDLKGSKLPGRKESPTTYMQFVKDSMDAVTDKEARRADPEDNISYLEDLHTRHERTTAYFVSISNRIPFLTLLRMHFSSAIWGSWQARKDIQNHHVGCLPLSSGHPWRNRNVELYFCYLPRYIEFMSQGTGGTKCADEELVVEAWLMLMARAYLFRELEGTTTLEGGYLPSALYGSRLPVWLS